MQPLEGLRIVDVTSGPVGGLATMVLADFGAEVVRVEPAGGDLLRAEAHARVWLRGKRSVVCSDAQLDALVVRTADAVVADRPLDFNHLRRERSDLVCGAIVPFEGLPLDEAAMAARFGRMAAFRGSVGRDGPVFSAVRVATHATAQAVAAGIAAATLCA